MNFTIEQMQQHVENLRAATMFGPQTFQIDDFGNHAPTPQSIAEHELALDNLAYWERHLAHTIQWGAAPAMRPMVPIDIPVPENVDQFTEFRVAPTDDLADDLELVDDDDWAPAAEPVFDGPDAVQVFDNEFENWNTNEQIQAAETALRRLWDQVTDVETQWQAGGMVMQPQVTALFTMCDEYGAWCDMIQHHAQREGNQDQVVAARLAQLFQTGTAIWNQLNAWTVWSDRDSADASE